MDRLSNVINVVQTWSSKTVALVSILAVRMKSVRIPVSYLETVKLRRLKKTLWICLSLSAPSQMRILCYVMARQVFSWRHIISLNLGKPVLHS